MGHRLSRPASRRFRIVAASAAACLGLVVAAPAVAVVHTGVSEVSARVAAAEPVGVNDCYSTDNGDPRLIEFRYGPGRVNVVGKRAIVRFRVRARDTGGPGPASGLRAVTVWFGTSGGDDPGTAGHDLTEASDGWWAGSVTVPRRVPNRVWPVVEVDLRDRAGNVRGYGRGALQRLTGRSLAVSINTARDKTPPRLTAFSVTPTAVNTREAVKYVTFTARMVDTESDIADDEVVVDGAGDTSWLSPDTGSIILDKVAGSRDLFRARVPVPRWVGNRTWRTTDVWAWNTADGSVVYSRRKLTALGFHGDVTVLSDTDRVRAQAQSFEVSAKAFDVRGGDARVFFRVHATDAVSGVNLVTVGTEWEFLPRPPSGWKFVVLRRVSGTRQDGVWTGSGSIRHCRVGTGIWRLRMDVYDRNGSILSGNDSRSYEAKDLAAHGWQYRIRVTAGDHVRPRVVVRSQTVPAGPIRMRFTEAVQGIDSVNARVQQIGSDGSRGPVTLGLWRCFDGRGHRTTCRTGDVREARFRPRHRLRAGARYAVTLNPEHHLGITDLAGNPLRQSVRHLRVTR